MTDSRRILDDALYAHFITFSVRRRRQLLDLEQPKRIVLGVLNEVMVSHHARCLGFVLMPEHIHALIWFSVIGQLSRFMHEWKRMSSIEIRKWYRECASSYFSGFGEGEKFWQPKYHSFEIYEARKLEEKLIYMHLNPVRRGLAKQAIDWKWSSAKWYELKQDVGVPIQWIP